MHYNILYHRCGQSTYWRGLPHTLNHQYYFQNRIISLWDLISPLNLIILASPGYVYRTLSFHGKTRNSPTGPPTVLFLPLLAEPTGAPLSNQFCGKSWNQAHHKNYTFSTIGQFYNTCLSTNSMLKLRNVSFTKTPFHSWDTWSHKVRRRWIKAMLRWWQSGTLTLCEGTAMLSGFC